jgi:hypothetical protein
MIIEDWQNFLDRSDVRRSMRRNTTGSCRTRPRLSSIPPGTGSFWKAENAPSCFDILSESNNRFVQT